MRQLLRCALLLACAAASASAALLPPAGCPAEHWAVRHAAWQRAHGAGAPRLTWVTAAASPGGWGDRVRGSLLALRIAAANNRTLHLRWGGRHALRRFLRPATFDWRPPRRAAYACVPPGDACDAAAGATLVLERQMGAGFAARRDFDGELAAALALGRDVVIDVRRSASEALPRAGAAPVASAADLACAWAVLYAPTRALAARGERALAALNLTRPYAAAHLRLGGLEGERKALARLAELPHAGRCPLALAQSVTTCAAALHAPQPQRVLVVTDNAALRAALARGSVAGAVGPGYAASHVSLAAREAAAAGAVALLRPRWDAWLDLYMLAHAEALVASASGFSDAATWWGGAARATADAAGCARDDAGFAAACEAERARADALAAARGAWRQLSRPAGAVLLLLLLLRALARGRAAAAARQRSATRGQGT